MKLLSNDNPFPGEITREPLENKIDTMVNFNAMTNLNFPEIKNMDDLNKMKDFIFPENCLDINGQQVDLMFRNSWIKDFSEIPFMEFAEVQIINTWAPYLLCFYLKPLMQKNPLDQKYIINVSSTEGRFNKFKNTHHPHTNMAKAALDMLTRTCGKDFAKSNIFMNSVDTGWVSEMYPLEFTKNRTVPLDEIDGAMRVLDPIIMGFNNKQNVHSMFFKDYNGTQLGTNYQ